MSFAGLYRDIAGPVVETRNVTWEFDGFPNVSFAKNHRVCEPSVTVNCDEPVQLTVVFAPLFMLNQQVCGCAIGSEMVYVSGM